MIDITPEKLGVVLEKVHRIKYKELGPIYITAALMVEANAMPEEFVAYIEEHYMLHEQEATV